MEEPNLPVYVVTMKLTGPQLSFYYPVVLGLPDPAVQDRINRLIPAQINRLLLDTTYYEYPPNASALGRYEIKTNEGNKLSLSLVLEYYGGGAHGITLTDSLTFNTQTGQLYEFKDLFAPGSEYMQAVNRLIEQQIAERGLAGMVDFISVDSDQPYYMADKTLVVYFNVYDIAAYAAGPQYFPIPLYQLEGLAYGGSPVSLLQEYI
jgi:hypothetical protein